MVELALAGNSWRSHDSDVGAMRLHNLYIAENPFTQDQTARYVRPSLQEHTTVGAGPIYGIWQQKGSGGDAMFVVSGQSLYKIPNGSTTPTLLGTVTGTGYCQFAGNEDRVIVVRNSVAYVTDGTTVSTITMPDDLPVGSVAQINGDFLLSVEGTFTFYWMLPGETEPDALNFASAERLPDPIISINIISDEIWIIGTNTVEVWATTDDQDAPYQRIPGRAYTDGTASRNVVADSSFNGFPCLLWVTNENQVVLSQGQPKRISNESIEESLRRSENTRAWAFRANRNDFYVITTDTETMVYNLTRQSWSTWSSQGYNYWRSHLGWQIDSDVYGGDALNGTIWQLGYRGIDGTETPIVSVVSGFASNSGKYMPFGLMLVGHRTTVTNLSLSCDGLTTTVSLGPNPCNSLWDRRVSTTLT